MTLPEVFVANEQQDKPIDTDRWMHLAQQVLKAEGIHDKAELCLLFVDKLTIAELNKRFLGKDYPTDVLAFPLDEEAVDVGRFPDSGGSGPGWSQSEEEVPRLVGDVVISPLVAFENAKNYNKEFEDEIALLVVHGILHLLGMDHMEDQEAEVMEKREQELLSQFYRQ